MTASSVLVGVVALEHAGFFVLESFLFRTPLGLKVFRLTPQAAEACAVFAANQGVYNGFLSAGLVWGLVAAPDAAPAIKTFFLACVVVAGLVGGATASRSIWLVQALPALVALALLKAGR
jgi:putative membrane protein